MPGKPTETCQVKQGDTVSLTYRLKVREGSANLNVTELREVVKEAARFHLRLKYPDAEFDSE